MGRTIPVTNTIPIPSHPPPCTSTCTLWEPEMQGQARAATSLLEEGESWQGELPKTHLTVGIMYILAGCGQRWSRHTATWCTLNKHRCCASPVTSTAAPASNVTGLKAAKWLYLKLKRKVQSFEVRRHIMNSAKLYISKPVLFAEAICPEKSSNMHLWQESKELRETDLIEDVSDHPFPQYLKCHFVVEQLPSLYQLQHLHPAPTALLAFEETVQSSSSQQFLIRYANKTSLLVPPDGNSELSEAVP